MAIASAATCSSLRALTSSIAPPSAAPLSTAVSTATTAISQTLRSTTTKSQNSRLQSTVASSFLAGEFNRNAFLPRPLPSVRFVSTIHAHASSSPASPAGPAGSPSAPLLSASIPSASAAAAAPSTSVMATADYAIDDSTSTSSDEESLETLYQGGRRRSGVASAAAAGSDSEWGSVTESDEEGAYSSEGELIDDDEEEEDDDVIYVNAQEAESRDELAIESLGLAKVIEQALLKRGIARLFPIQHAVLAPSMQGRDIIARAKTGTGKTLAFGIPILEKITREIDSNGGRRPFRGPRCLVLAPTRELAKQVEREFCESAPNLSTVCVYGGVSIENQIRQIRRGVDIAVGTPGRLIDLINRGSLSLMDVHYVVLDEADQMLAVGFEEDVEKIMENLPDSDGRQMSLFSATMPSWVKKLSRKYLTNPLTIDLVGEKDEKLAEGIRMLSVRAPGGAKRAILADLITVYALGGKTIVFTQTKKDADEVAMALGRSVGCEALHGDIPQQQRERTLQAFREGRFVVLVATDVASRGLDIPNVDLVIHYEVPSDSETFVHRSGRTGRAGKTGCTILMHSDSQLRTLRTIEREIGSPFERVSAPHHDDVLQASAVQSAALIGRVHPELAESFLGMAEQLLEHQGPMALAAAIAHLSGFSQPPAPRSLLTHEENFLTVRLIRTARSRNSPLTSPRAVMGTLSEIFRPAADSVGKIRILGDRDVEGAVFDLPAAVAKELVGLPIDNGDVFDIPKQLPKLVEDDRARGGRGDRGGDSYGRFSRDGGRGGGGGRGERYGGRERGDRGGGEGARGGDRGFRRGDDSVRRDRPSSPFSRDFDDRRGGSRDRLSAPPPRRSSYGGGGDSWESSSEGSGDGYYAQRSRSSEGSSSGRGGGMFDRSGGGGGGRGNFSGVCFLCKQPGHRAADCPVVAGR